MASDLEVQLTAPNGQSWAQPTGLFINNEFVKSQSEEKITSINPYNEKDICSVYAASKDDVDKAVSAARNALQHPSWKRLSGTERGALMNKLADLLEENRELLATIDTLDNGKAFNITYNSDVPNSVSVLRYYAGFADKNFGQLIDAGPDRMAYTLKQPIGVCGQIIPWNYPLEMAAWKLGPALCCGNTIVMKLAEQTPLSMLVVGRLIKEAGFPPGVINIINGYGREAGAALVEHEGVDKIAFTGSTATGKTVMKAASATMKPITLETGGKSPLLLFDDANLDQAVRWAHEGLFSHQGQNCCATSRILVQNGVYDAFVEKFTAFTEKTTIVGDPFDLNTYQGPQVSKVQRDRIMGYITSAKDDGCKIYQPPAGVPKEGYFIPPTIFTEVPLQSAVFREEIFGPCVAVVRFDTEEDALAIANNTRYGLASAVFTKDLARAHRLSKELESGTVWVNSSNDSDVRLPFGGFKESGIGRELGAEGLKGYYSVKGVWINLTDE